MSKFDALPITYCTVDVGVFNGPVALCCCCDDECCAYNSCCCVNGCDGFVDVVAAADGEAANGWADGDVVEIVVPYRFLGRLLRATVVLPLPVNT